MFRRASWFIRTFEFCLSARTGNPRFSDRYRENIQRRLTIPIGKYLHNFEVAIKAEHTSGR
jgi:hypothetical protein